MKYIHVVFKVQSYSKFSREKSCRFRSTVVLSWVVRNSDVLRWVVRSSVVLSSDVRRWVVLNSVDDNCFSKEIVIRYCTYAR
jgi:hypothetical protein